MKRIVTFLNGITSQGVATVKLVFIPGPCFLTGFEAPKSVRPLLLALSIPNKFLVSQGKARPFRWFFRRTGVGALLPRGYRQRHSSRQYFWLSVSARME
ncbi:MAG: hypothetical protein A4E57_03395 [Syntrophorhabdaceae bacterium PtaU1.Bin034]|nr:MAG: hypothetical protein A4E57_03395 [Syntrophorhabdaceae bacterium PtaU1.Bin034]